MRSIIREYIADIQPYDALELQHQKECLRWIDAGDQLFRIKKPNIPSRHLVAYFILVDLSVKKILLVDHKLAELWLPTGGHVEIDEDPKETVRRECQEELGVKALPLLAEPLMLTLTTTVGKTAGHEDVSLWFVLEGNALDLYQFDADEFHRVQWFDWENIPKNSDPHMQRFIAKLKSYF